MSRTIWKATLQPADLQEIEVPVGAELLCAREQFDEISVWFRCDPTEPKKEARAIAVVKTGAPAPGDEGRYIGTAALRGGRVICHVFERATPPTTRGEP